MKDITARISAFVAELNFDHLPEQVVEQVTLFIADFYAACFAGYRINRELNEKVLTLMTRMGGCEESTVLFSGQKLPACNAAYMNALYAHGADMDDGNRKAAGHVATHVMPAVFALAETLPVTWQDVVTAIVAGYEVFNRVVGAAQPGLYNKGFHSTGVGGSLACAAACGKLLGLDAEGIYNAISLSAIQSSGLIIIDESGQGCKPINPANAARTGLFSAQLAQQGLESSRDPLESKKGWYNAFTDRMDEDILFDGLGQTYTICESYLKLYPACRHTHCGIDGILELRQQLLHDGFTPEDVEAIHVTVYPSAIRSTGSIAYPATGDQAKFSLRYCVAAALHYGIFGLDQLDVAACRNCFRLIDKIQLYEDPSLEDRAAGIRGAKLELTVTDGKTYCQTVLIPRGEASKPLGWAEIAEKLSACAGSLCSRDRQHAFLAGLRQLDATQPFTLPNIA